MSERRDDQRPHDASGLVARRQPLRPLAVTAGTGGRAFTLGVLSSSALVWSRLALGLREGLLALAEWLWAFVHGGASASPANTRPPRLSDTADLEHALAGL